MLCSPAFNAPLGSWDEVKEEEERLKALLEAVQTEREQLKAALTAEVHGLQSAVDATRGACQELQSPARGQRAAQSGAGRAPTPTRCERWGRPAGHPRGCGCAKILKKIRKER